MSYNFPPSSSDSSKPILIGVTIKGDPGEDPVVAQVTPSMLAIPCENNGTPRDYTNANAEVRLMQSGEIIAEPGDEDGWSIEVTSQTNVTTTAANLAVQIDSITGNIGEVTLRVYKASIGDFEVSLTVVKVRDGDQGDPGTTGAIGATGPIGPKGEKGKDGNGLVVKHFQVTVKETAWVAIASAGGYLYDLTFSGSHGYSVGDRVQLFVRDWGVLEIVDLNVGATVTTIISSTVIRVKADDLSPGSSSNCVVRDYHNFAKDYSGANTEFDIRRIQILQFNGIIPVGGKLEHIMIQKSSGGNCSMRWNAGHNIEDSIFTHPDDGVYSQASPEYIANKHTGLSTDNNKPIGAYMGDPNHPMYNDFFQYLETDTERDVIISAYTENSGEYFYNTANDNVYDIFITYRNFVAEDLLSDEIFIENSDSGNIIVGNTTDHNAIRVMVSVTRNSKSYTQEIIIVYNGVDNPIKSEGNRTPYISSSPNLGVTFTADENSGNIRLNYSVGSSLGNGKIKYDIIHRM